MGGAVWVSARSSLRWSVRLPRQTINALHDPNGLPCNGRDLLAKVKQSAVHIPPLVLKEMTAVSRRKLDLARLFILIAAITRWPPFVLLLVGLINVPACFWAGFWGLDWRIGLAALTLLAFVAGWVTPAKVWQVVLVLLVPLFFLGSARHGRPWQWLIGGLMYPPLLIYFLFNMGPSSPCMP